jgi:hypothetical protein
MIRRYLALTICLLVACGSAAAADHTSDVAIMTQNMDDGTDLTYIVAAALGAIPGFSVPDAVDLTYAELQASNFPGRAGYTWPLYAEDLIPAPPFFGPAHPKERIDLVFEQGVQVLSIEKVLSPAPSLAGPPFGSDHAGVITVLRP